MTLYVRIPLERGLDGRRPYPCYRTVLEDVVKVSEELFYIRDGLLQVTLRGIEYALYNTDVSDGMDMFIRDAAPDETAEEVQAYCKAQHAARAAAAERASKAN